MRLLKNIDGSLINWWGLIKLPIIEVFNFISWTLNTGWLGNRSLDSVGTDDRQVIGGGRLIGTIDLKCINTGILAGDVITAIDSGADPLNVAGEIIFEDGIEYGPFEVTRNSVVIGRYYLQEIYGVVLINQFRGANALANGELSGTLAINQRGTSAIYTSAADEIGYYRADGINDYLDAAHTTLYDYGTIVPHDSENPTKALVWDINGVQQDLQFVYDAKLSFEIGEQAGYRITNVDDSKIILGTSNGNLNGSWSIIYDFIPQFTQLREFSAFFAKTDGDVNPGAYLLYCQLLPHIRFLYRTDTGTTKSLLLPEDTYANLIGSGNNRAVIDYNESTSLLRVRIGKYYNDVIEEDCNFNSNTNLNLNYFNSGRAMFTSVKQFAILNRNLTDSEFWNDDFVWGKSDEDFNLEFSSSKYECYDTVGGGVYPYLGTLYPAILTRIKSLKSTMYRNGFNIYDDGAIAPKTNSGADITRSGQSIVTSVASSTGINKLLDSVYKYSLPKSKRLWQSVASFFTNGIPNLYTGAELEAQVNLEAKATITTIGNELSDLKITE